MLCYRFHSLVAINGARCRIAGENATAKREAEVKEEERRARKRRRLQDYGAIHGQDMTVVTKENVHTRPGWTVTPLGRIIRPMKMRPLRPLARPDTSVGKGVVKKKKKKKVEVELRAKRQKIDMLKHGSVHLKGVFVDVTIPDSGYAAHASGSCSIDDHAPTKAVTRESDETIETVGYKTDSSEESEVEDEDEDEDEDEGENEDEDKDEDEDEDEDEGLSDEEHSTAENRQSNSTLTSTNKLKELFAPRDEEGSSGLRHMTFISDLKLYSRILSSRTSRPRFGVGYRCPFPSCERRAPILADIPRGRPTTNHDNFRTGSYSSSTYHSVGR